MPRPKPKPKTFQTGFRLTESRKTRIEERARANGQSLQEFISESVKLREGIADEFWNELGKLSKVMQLPVATIIANKIIKLVSYDFIWKEITGSPPPGALSEFAFDELGLITGEALLKKMNTEHRKLLTDLKAELEKSIKTGDPAYVTTDQVATYFFGFKTEKNESEQRT